MANKIEAQTNQTLAELNRLKPNDEITLITKDGKHGKIVKIK